MIIQCTRICVKIHSGSSLEVDPFVKVFHEFSKSVYSLISWSPVWNSQTYNYYEFKDGKAAKTHRAFSLIGGLYCSHVTGMYIYM